MFIAAVICKECLKIAIKVYILLNWFLLKVDYHPFMCGFKFQIFIKFNCLWSLFTTGDNYTANVRYFFILFEVQTNSTHTRL